MGESESSADVVMDSVTPYSNWEQLDLNDNPSERFNCFITTAAGLLELDSVRKFEIKPYMTEYVRDALLANERFNTDYIRGAYLDELKAFYCGLGIVYINQFNSRDEVLDYFKDNVQRGVKKKFAFAYCYTEDVKKAIEKSIGCQIKSTSLSHIVAVKIDKTHEDDNRHYFRVIDFQIPRADPNRNIKNDLPRNAIPPFHLFEKIFYKNQNFNQ